MKNYEKEGQVGGSVGAIIQLIVGVGVATLVLIFVGTLGGQTYQISEAKLDEIGVNAVTESFTAVNGTAYSLLHPTDLHTGSVVVYNGSGSVVTGNFTVDYTNAFVNLSSSAFASYNNTAHTVSYSWGLLELQSSVKNAVISSFGALEQTGDYLPIVVLAVIIALVMSLVLGFTAFNSGGGNGGNAL